MHQMKRFQIGLENISQTFGIALRFFAAASGPPDFDEKNRFGRENGRTNGRKNFFRRLICRII